MTLIRVAGSTLSSRSVCAPRCTSAVQAACKLIEDRQRNRYFASKRRRDPFGGGHCIDRRRQRGEGGERAGLGLEQHAADAGFEPFELRLPAWIGERLALGSAQQERIGAARREDVAHPR